MNKAKAKRSRRPEGIAIDLTSTAHLGDVQFNELVIRQVSQLIFANAHTMIPSPDTVIWVNRAKFLALDIVVSLMDLIHNRLEDKNDVSLCDEVVVCSTPVIVLWLTRVDANTIELWFQQRKLRDLKTPCSELKMVRVINHVIQEVGNAYLCYEQELLVARGEVSNVK